MFKRIDSEQPDCIEGFSYLNKDNELEFVEVSTFDNTVNILTEGRTVIIYQEDIPNLIKALQSSYDFLKAIDE